MLFKKMLRTIWHYKAQFISMIFMVMLGVGVFFGFQCEWFSIEKNTFYFYDKTGFADYRLVDESGYSETDLDKILAIEGVDKAARYLSVLTNEGKENETVSLTVTTNEEVSGFLIMSGEEYDASSSDGVWISDQYAEKNDYKIGDEITLKYNLHSITGKIKGMIKSSEYLICIADENQMMPDFNKYGYVYISPLMFKTMMGGIEYYPQINVLSNLDRIEFCSKVNEALGKTNLILTKDEIVSYAEAQGEATEGKTMASILPVVFLAIAILIMATTMQRLMINEKTQIGTLKALGFRDRKIVKHYTFFGLAVGLIGSILGIGLGYFIAWFIFNPNGSMGTYFDLPIWTIYFPWWSILVIIGMIAFMTLISFIATKNILKGNAADALKPYVPKAMKRWKIEDSKGWRRMKFSTKWNLRDIFRHKARSGMTLFGVVGCMVLLVASFLMMDSTKGFVNKFYWGSMNYESMIILSQTTTNEKAVEMASYFDADYCSSSSVSLNESAISIDIYHIENDYMKFLDKNMNFVKLEDNGVYIGQRLKQENNLKIGDELTIAVYGSDITYKVVVAGEIRTLTKGIVLTENYAKEAGIAYKINKLYSSWDTKKINEDTTYSNDISASKSKSDIIVSFDSFMEVMYTMIGALITLSILLGVVVLYNLGVMSYFERYRELSTLKVVGFKDRRIGKLLITQNMWLTIIGCVIGFPLGVWITDILLKALAAEYEMSLMFNWMTFTIPVIVVVLTSFIVSLFVAKKNKKINMVEALKVPE
ncbi:MAG: ABC transporter permease [Bacilli bacterium]|nr:ABC transporter permease [Bacilli bacterium]